jgi:hypothetical protein
MRFILFLVFSCIISTMTAQINLTNLKSVVKKTISSSELSQAEVGEGLKEALILGVKNASSDASREGGFSTNLLIRISFPKDAEKMKKTLLRVGMQPQVTKFEETLNAAAEDASQFAKEIFIDAVKKITIKDAISILKGKDYAATTYLKNQTSNELYAKFKPVVKRSIAKVKLTKHWNMLANRYNALPLSKKVSPDLEDYITIQAIDGLFILIANQEKEIRNNPKARVSEILQKVFK